MPTVARAGLLTFALTAPLWAAVGVRPVQVAGAPEASVRTRAFLGARLVDGTGGAPIEDALLVVRDGRIEYVGPRAGIEVPVGAARVDVGGKTIVPGLINTHGHVGETRGLESGPELYSRENVLDQLALYARYGVTTVVSLGGDQETGLALRAEQMSPRLARARLYAAGTVVAAAAADEARAAVDAVAALGVDIVKMRVDDNLGTTAKMPEAAFRAVIEQAHLRKLRVAAHLFYLDDAKALLRAGLDFVAHSIRDRDVDDELIGLLTSRDVCVCPTLMREVSTFVYETTPDFFTDRFFLAAAAPAVLAELREPQRQASVRASVSAQRYKQALEVASRNTKRLVSGGVRIAFGTDTGPPGRFQGYFEHLELERMVQAGLTPMQALVSATGDAARCQKLAGVGTLTKGAWADLVVLDKDPLASIANTRMIRSVWIAGNLVPGSDAY